MAATQPRRRPGSRLMVGLNAAASAGFFVGVLLDVIADEGFSRSLAWQCFAGVWFAGVAIVYATLWRNVDLSPEPEDPPEVSPAPGDSA